MSQSPAQKAAFQKMIAARKAKSGQAGTAETASVGVRPKIAAKTSRAPARRVAGSNVKKTVANIRQKLSSRKKNKTQIGFD